MEPRRAAMLVCVVTLASPARSSGSRWAVSAKWARWFVPSCSSKPSLVVCRSGGVITPALLMRIRIGVPSWRSFSPRAATDASEDSSRSSSDELRRGVPGADRRQGRLTLDPVADGHHDLGPGAGECRRDAESDAVARSRDHRSLTGEVGDGEVVLSCLACALLRCRFGALVRRPMSRLPDAERVIHGLSIPGWACPGAGEDGSVIDREGLADFLRRRREALQPEDVGLPRGQRRRTSGLRREEVAALCHMSTDYYSRLEQERGPQPSEQMIASIAQGLHLSRAERDHLFRLAGHQPPAAERGQATTSAPGRCGSSTGSPTPRRRSSPSWARRCARPRSGWRWSVT